MTHLHWEITALTPNEEITSQVRIWMGGRFNREGTYVFLWLIHILVWQKPM